MRLPGRVVVPLNSMCSSTCDKPGAEPAAFVNAAGHAPRLRRHDRRAVVFAHDDGQAVVERGQSDAGGRRRGLHGQNSG